MKETRGDNANLRKIVFYIFCTSSRVVILVGLLFVCFLKALIEIWPGTFGVARPLQYLAVPPSLLTIQTPVAVLPQSTANADPGWQHFAGRMGREEAEALLR